MASLQTQYENFLRQNPSSTFTYDEWLKDLSSKIKGALPVKPMITEYVCGLMFNPERNQVLLIRKDRPEWQAGKLNGVGGKIELIDRMMPVNIDNTPYGAPALFAMQREFYEEVGIWTGIEEWDLFAILQGQNSKVYVFRAFSEKLYDALQVESEAPEIHFVPLLHKQVTVPNVQWLVPMALETNEVFTINCQIKGGNNAGTTR